MYRAADGWLYYYAKKSIPIGDITACAADAANPGQRKNADPDGEERYTFTLSVERACDGDVSNVNLTTNSLEACPPLITDACSTRPIIVSALDRAQTLPACACSACPAPGRCPWQLHGGLDGKQRLCVRQAVEGLGWLMDLSFECCTRCPAESTLEMVDLSDNRLAGPAPNWLATMLKGTIKTLNLKGNRLTGDYKALDNLASGFIRAESTRTVVQIAPQQECPTGEYRKTNANAQQDLGTCELTPPVEAELVVQSKDAFIVALQKPSSLSTGQSISLVLNVQGGSSFAPQYSAVMVRHGAPLATGASISMKTLATLGKDQAEDRQLSLDGLHAKWQVIAPSDDSAVPLSASVGNFSKTKNYTLTIYVDCSGAKPCVADGDTVTTNLTIGNASSPNGQRSQVRVNVQILAVPSCIRSRSMAVLVASAGQVEASTESVRLEAQLVDVDALPINFSNPKAFVLWANKSFPLQRAVVGSNRFHWEIPSGLRREPGLYPYKVILDEAWDEVERNRTRCTLLEGTLSIVEGFDTKWVLVGSILGAVLLISLALLFVRRHHERLMAIAVMLVNEIVKLGLSLGLEIGDIVTECAPKHTHWHVRTRMCVRACMATEAMFAGHSAFLLASMSYSTNRSASAPRSAPLTPSLSSSRWSPPSSPSPIASSPRTACTMCVAQAAH
jgi:hypothetical protein